MNHGKCDLSEITVGRPQPEPIVIPRNPDGTFTLSSGKPARTYPPLTDGQFPANVDDIMVTSIPRPVGLLDRRLQARAALEGNEMLMVDGVIRIRRKR